MKTRVTFRIQDDLARTLRELPNQTKFVEDALRDALGRACPVCDGVGRLPMRSLHVSNIRDVGMQRLSSTEARQLQKVFRLGQELAATRIELEKRGRRVKYAMKRNEQDLLSGTLNDQGLN